MTFCPVTVQKLQSKHTQGRGYYDVTSCYRLYSSGSGGGAEGAMPPPSPVQISHKKDGGHIDFMFLAPPLTRSLDPLLRQHPPGQELSPVNKRAVRILLECFLFGEFNDSNVFCKGILWETSQLSFSNAMRQCYTTCSQQVVQRGQGHKTRSRHETSMNYQVKFVRSAIISFN